MVVPFSSAIPWTHARGDHTHTYTHTNTHTHTHSSSSTSYMQLTWELVIYISESSKFASIKVWWTNCGLWWLWWIVNHNHQRPQLVHHTFSAHSALCILVFPVSGPPPPHVHGMALEKGTTFTWYTRDELKGKQGSMLPSTRIRSSLWKRVNFLANSANKHQFIKMLTHHLEKKCKICLSYKKEFNLPHWWTQH